MERTPFLDAVLQDADLVLLTEWQMAWIVLLCFLGGMAIGSYIGSRKNGR